MSPDQELLNLAGSESESKALFDELAGLVPAERPTEYYRVIAHFLGFLTCQQARPSHSGLLSQTVCALVTRR